MSDEIHNEVGKNKRDRIDDTDIIEYLIIFVKEQLWNIAENNYIMELIGLSESKITFPIFLISIIFSLLFVR